MTSLAIVPRMTDRERPADLIRVAVPRLNENDSIGEYLSQLETRDYDVSWARVMETKVLTCAEWNELMQGLLTDRDWLAGKGGCSSWAFADDDDREFFKLSSAEQDEWRRTSYLHVIAVQCGGKTIYIDPQGYNYARYVAFAADGMEEGKTREELRRERAKTESVRLQAEKLARIKNQIENPPAIPANHGLKFLWNGIKVKGELYRSWYSIGNLVSPWPSDTISVSARDYHSFPAEVRACFDVENNTDMQSDYFDSDRLRICSTHPLYSLAKEAHDAAEAHHARRMAKRGL